LIEKHSDFTRVYDNLCERCALKMKKPSTVNWTALKIACVMCIVIAVVGIILSVYVYLKQILRFEDNAI